MSVLMELIQFCEANFLSTALLYLHTAVYNQHEEALCVPVILALLALYRQAKRSNPGTLEEIRCIKDLSPDSMERSGPHRLLDRSGIQERSERRRLAREARRAAVTNACSCRLREKGFFSNGLRHVVIHLLLFGAHRLVCDGPVLT